MMNNPKENKESKNQDNGIKLDSRNLFIDTQYFINKSFNFNSPGLVSLERLVSENRIKVFMTDITIMECQKKISEEIEKSYTKLKKSDIRYLKTIPLFSRFIEIYSPEKAISFFNDKLNKFIKKCQVEIIPSDQVKCSTIYRQYVDQRPPFNKKGPKDRKSEFPDSFALETILGWCQENRQKTYVISGDSDWEEFAATSYITPMDNDIFLLHLADLPQLLNAVIRNAEELQNLTGFADGLINTNLPLIEKSMLNRLKEYTEFEFDVGHGDIELEVEIEDSEILSVSIVDKEITSVNDAEADYSFEIFFDVIFTYEITDYDNSPYDPEDKEYIYIKTNTIHKKHKFNLGCIVTIGYKDGISRNFRVLDVGIPDTLYVDFYEGEEFDIEEHTLQLPVIVCGVKEGEITTPMCQAVAIQ